MLKGYSVPVVNVNTGEIAFHCSIHAEERLALIDADISYPSPEWKYANGPIVYPLHFARITRGFGKDRETFIAQAAFQSGYLFYVKDDSTQFVKRCKLDTNNGGGKLKLLIYRDHHEIEFIGKVKKAA